MGRAVSEPHEPKRRLACREKRGATPRNRWSCRERAPPPEEPLDRSGHSHAGVYAADLCGFPAYQAEPFREAASGFPRGSGIGWLGAYLGGGGEAVAFADVERCAWRRPFPAGHLASCVF